MMNFLYGPAGPPSASLLGLGRVPVAWCHVMLAITSNPFRIVSSSCLFPSRLMLPGVRSFRAAEWPDRIERLFKTRSI